MSKIAVFARLRPPNSQPYSQINCTPDGQHIQLSFGSKDAPILYSEAQYRQYTFQFNKVFNQTCTQEEVYANVGKDIVGKFLQGYNGTIFAYGQTASGKTYTIEGSARCYAERGLAPRVISDIYKSLEDRKVNEDLTLYVSYMELYQETAYDLLNPCNRGLTINTVLPKVTVSEGPYGDVMLKNISCHLAPTEQVALNLLFEGSTCRKVAETVMNAASSRSHSIFTLTLIAQQFGSEIRTKSKLHLVDLAGSERVAKTGADGLILQEAKYINLSLHHLEHVIVTLQRSNKNQEEREGRPLSTGYIPYRNSLLTMLLKDSLGGNCNTIMIATLSPDAVNIMETLSTCRFSQRVACISNIVKRNEELDDKAVIRKLKKRIIELEQELLSLKQPQESISNNDRSLCHKILYNYLHGHIDNPVTEGINTVERFHECLSVLKDVILHSVKRNGHTLSLNDNIYHLNTVTSTNVPVTPSPVITSPVTTVPMISVPLTSVPMTNVPMTSSLVTSVSATTAPETSVPATSIPVTTAPVTSTPATSASVTTAPVTSTPATSAPVTSVHTATVPVTSVPVTTTTTSSTSVPVTTSPATIIPMTSSPVTIKRVTSVPINNTPISPVHTNGTPLFKQQASPSYWTDKHQPSSPPVVTITPSIFDTVVHKKTRRPLETKSERTVTGGGGERGGVNNVMSSYEMRKLKEDEKEEEQVRLLELEKQLQIKEEATRQRLYLLKQQLLSGQTSNNELLNTPRTDSHTNTPRTHSCTVKTDSHTSTSTRFHSYTPGTHSYTMRTDSSIINTPPKTHSYTTRTDSYTSPPKTHSYTTRTDSYTSTTPKTHSYTTRTDSYTSPSKTHSYTTRTDSYTSPPKTHSYTSRTDTHTSTPPKTHSYTTNKDLTKDHQKEEEPTTGEMEYYSTAIKRQRERVNRIRQCVAAAIIIQKAWRKYNENK